MRIRVHVRKSEPKKKSLFSFRQNLDIYEFDSQRINNLNGFAKKWSDVSPNLHLYTGRNSFHHIYQVMTWNGRASQFDASQRSDTLSQRTHTRTRPTTTAKWKQKNYCSINILFILFSATYIISTEFMVLIYDATVAARSLLKMAQRDSKWPHRVCAYLVPICLLSANLSVSHPAISLSGGCHSVT